MWKIILFRIIHARNQITKLFIEPCPLSGKVFAEHYIGKSLSVMHGLRIEQTHIEDVKKLKKLKYSSHQLQSASLKTELHLLPVSD